MSSIRKATVMEYPRGETESSPFVSHKRTTYSRCGVYEFAEFVRKLSKSTWFCEVAEAWLSYRS
jgi:hypothetical protein